MFVANHPILHIEIPATNPGAVGTFYSDVFGWKIETNPEHNYVDVPVRGWLPWRICGAFGAYL